MMAVLYARFSCSRQREASIEDQLQACRAFCEREGLEVVREYADYAISGRTDERPQFQAMVAAAGEAEFVVVYMMDRFSRDPYDAPIYKKRLLKKGVRVVSALERIDSSPDGIIMEKLLEGLAARESMVTAIRAKRGMEGNARKCLYNGVRVYGYTVEDGRYAIDPQEAACVRHAFEMRIAGASFNEIAAYLRSMGARTSTGRPATPSMANHMIRNRKYKGVYFWDEVEVPGGMPVIVDGATWEAAQRAVGRKDKRGEVVDAYALSGRAICGECGGTVHGASARNHAGVKYCYYRCKDGHVRLRRDLVEGRIATALRGLLDGEEAYAIAERVKKAWSGADTEQRANAALNAATEASNARSNILRAIEDGLPYASVRERLEELEETERSARAEYELHRHDAEFDVDDFVDFLRFGATLGDADLLDAFVFQVMMFNDRLVVTLNYDDAENTPKRLDLGVLACGEFGGPNVFVCKHSIFIVVPLAA